MRERFFMCLALLVAIGGCGGPSYKAPPTTPISTAEDQESGSSVSGQAEGTRAFFLQAEAYSDTERQKTVFDADFTETGVVAIHLQVRNGTGHAARINRDDMALTLPDGHRLSPLSAHATASLVDEKTGTSITAGDVLGAVAHKLVTGLWIGGGQQSRDRLRAYESRARRIEDYENKEFKDALLAPGESQSGFVFFKPPPGTAAFDAAALNLLFIPAEGTAGERVSQTVTELAFAGREPDSSIAYVPRSRRGAKACDSGAYPHQRWLGSWEANADDAALSVDISDNRVTGRIATPARNYRVTGSVNAVGDIKAVIELPATEDKARLEGKFPVLVTYVDAPQAGEYRALTELVFHMCS